MMMLKYKNKALMLGAGAILSLGIAYQNCGQVTDTSANGELNKKTNLNALSSSGSSNIAVLSLKDGTKIKMKIPQDQMQPIVLTLKDGTKIKVGSK